MIHLSNNNVVYRNNNSENYEGIYLSNSNYNDVFKNILSKNEDNGIDIDTCIETLLHENLISENSDYGIDMDSSSRNQIYMNEVKDNIGGIDLDQASQNNIYSNNFVGNNAQTSYDIEVNIWNSAYPTGGNYWSNYEGIDVMSGPSQKVDSPGGDGIGDTAHVLKSFIIDNEVIIDEDNLDLLPLMQPYTINVGRDTTSITCNVAPSTVTEGETVTVSGTLSVDLGEEGLVELSVEKPSGAETQTDVILSPSGAYSYTFEPDAVGLYHVAVHWGGDILYKGSNAASSFTVEEYEPLPEVVAVDTRITLSLVGVGDTGVETGQTVTVSLRLEDEEGNPIADKRVELAVTSPSGETQTSSGTTDEDGETELQVVCDEAGTWSVQSSWEGSEEYNEATKQFTVQVRAPASGNQGIPGFPLASVLMGAIFVSLALYAARVRAYLK
ncbi:right-handed parallel beta-helix repeat-containing protein [Candidatus Bathyarchaeota archaeon]|nr:right-handed parallel beta-helix repeat-containing protein [Candidatus Bathyarchaeota archaeon]